MTDTYPHTFFVHHLHVVFHTYWIFIFGYLLFRSIIQNAIVLSPVKYEILWFVYLYTNWSKVLWARLKLFLLTEYHRGLQLYSLLIPIWTQWLHLQRNFIWHFSDHYCSTLSSNINVLCYLYLMLRNLDISQPSCYSYWN